MQRPGTTINHLTAENLHSLYAYQENGAIILSLYMDIRGDASSPRGLIERFTKLVRQLEETKKLHQDPRVDQSKWPEETRRLRSWLEQIHSLPGQGLAVFSSLSTNFWQAHLLPVPVLDRLEASDRPYLRPLEVLLGESKPTLAVHVVDEAVHFFQTFLGSVHKVDHLSILPVTGAQGDDQQNLQSVVERLNSAWEEQPYQSLIVAGKPELSDRLLEQMPGTLKQYISQESLLETISDEHDFFNKLQTAETERESKIEEQRIDELLRGVDDGSAVLGLEQTLLGLKSRKLRMIIVEDSFHREGGVCPNCGFISEGDETQCLVCGMALRPEPDIIEAALHQMLEQGGEVEILRSRQARSRLEENGHIGALVHTPDTLPPERDMSNRQKMEDGKEVNRDVRHDEAIEESFPASDPPAWH